MTPLEISLLEGAVIRLPTPVRKYFLGDSYFEVHLARNGQAGWTSDVLEDLVILARRSYKRYGSRSLLDKYDYKSFIYLVRSVYLSKTECNKLMEEWLCIRMVPGHPYPQGAGELEIYNCKGIRLDEYVKNNFFGGNPDFWEQIVSSSRMCGIHPYHYDQTAHRITLNTDPKHLYTGLCFVLIHKQFIDDYPEPYRLVTAIIRGDFAGKALRFSRDARVVRHDFTPAFKFLNLNAKDIKLNNSKYIFNFPLYWLDLQGLKGLLKRLIKRGLLSEASLRHHLGDVSTPNILEAIGTGKIHSLSDLFGIEGKIEDSILTGQEFRQLVVEEVPEGPELKITQARDWNRSINNFLEFVQCQEAKAL